MSDKVKLADVAGEAGKSVKDALTACAELGFTNVRSVQGSVTFEQAAQLMTRLMSAHTPTIGAQQTEPSQTASPETKTERPKATARAKTDSKKRGEQPPKIQAAAEIKVEEKPLERAKLKTGLRIVNKKQNNRPTSSVSPESERSSFFTHGYGRNKVAIDAAVEERRPRRERKAVLATHRKDQSKRIDLLNDRELDSHDPYEEEVIIMPDLSIGVSDFLAEQERKEKNAKKDFERAKTLGGTVTRMVSDSGIARTKRRKSAHSRDNRTPESAESVSKIEIAEDVRVYEFAEKISRPIATVIKKLFEFGMMVTKNDFLGKDAIEVLAEEFGVEIRTKEIGEELDYVAEYDAEHSDRSIAAIRPPIVTIMGHVDHGKTSLLDYIRNSRVASGEAGGITQHIGAYTVQKSGKAITFIDTPGHEAFSQMRARGANTTDIVVIVIAADDGVMPQTKEAISHAKAAKCPMIVAINKIDKSGANIDKVKAELAETGLTPLDWGGDTECVGVSAKTGAGIDNLLETILLQAELMELKAQTDTLAKAIVIESSLEKGRGAVATLIVQNGTLKVGDNVVAGVSSGRIRAIVNDLGQPIAQLAPSEAGLVVGLDLVPSSGDTMIAMNDPEKAKAYAQKRSEYERQRDLSRSTKATLEDLGELIAEGKLKRLPIILKADVQGTLEAISLSLSRLRNEEIKAEIIHAAVGEISGSDIALAAASEHAIILGFHIKPSQIIKDKAKVMGVRINSYDVIYDLINDVSHILGGMLSKVTEERICGKAEVRQIFDIPKFGQIAGCMVTDGEVLRGAIAR
ncbi:MAG: translation initiation factor IF-2, partial [Helicobacteraceae bacterium]|nr:translation initiation factor IF-2 [Helicobacteraceae bacterium]